MKKTIATFALAALAIPMAFAAGNAKPTAEASKTAKPAGAKTRKHAGKKTASKTAAPAVAATPAAPAK